MSSEVVIRVENLSKCYKIQHANNGTRSSGDGLRHAISDAVAAPWRAMRQRFRGQRSDVSSLTSDLRPPTSSLPSASLPSTNSHLPSSRPYPSPSEDFFALRDVSFEVKRGEVLGIIGRNGAGKSTLLKILSRITEPTSGRIGIKGRVASLLEVGTGFHPELTGHENIFLNAAILGMSRTEVKACFDEIVAFAEIERFLDTPVKRYSSGMYVRLAFAVAAHLEPEILIVDEVLAVGDVQFQKKCLGKMQDIAAGSGRTVLFVSHNLDAIATLCSRCMVLKNGCVAYDGETPTAIKCYSGNQEAAVRRWQGSKGDDKVTLFETWVATRAETGIMDAGAPLEIGLRFTVHRPLEGLIVGYMLYSEYGYELVYSLHDDASPGFSPTTAAGEYVIRFSIPKNILAAGSYRIVFDIGIHMLCRIIDSPVGDLEFELDNLTGIGRRYLVGNVRGRRSLLRPQWPVAIEAREE